MARPANPELVTVAWLKTITAVGTSAATTLPEDNTSWATAGFVTVGPTVGGDTLSAYVPARMPVIQVDAWACNLNSDNPPWGKASDLIEAVRSATFDGTGIGVALTLRTGYEQVRVQAVTAMGSPRRIDNDPDGYARYSVDLQPLWVAL